MTRRLAVVLAFVAVLAASRPAHATTIVDTGPGPSPGGLILGPVDSDPGFTQWLAGEFFTFQPWTVTSVEGYIDPRISGNVRFALYTDGGEVPGNLLFSQTVAIPGTGATTWYGPNGLNWLLAAGTYWVAFEVDPSNSFRGAMPNPSATPLINEAFASLPPTWRQLDSLSIGARIEAEAVPEPATLFLMGTGLSVLTVRRRTRCG